MGEQFKVGNGFNIIGAHTDSPCLKVKPASAIEQEGYLQLGVSTYGGGLWYTWFDRDLAIGGRVIVRNPNGTFDHRLVFLNKPVCRVPSLAIHLGSAANKDKEFAWNKDDHLKPVLATVTRGVLEGSTDKKKTHHAVLLKALAAELKCGIEDICDFELCLCDHQPASIGGLQEEFLFAPRLDNLLSCWTALQSFLKSLPTLDRETRTRMVCFFDHEEVGSHSQNGADSDMVAITLDRINEALSKETVSSNLSGMSRRNSFLISADMAHGVHPNYFSVHEANQ